MPERRFVPKHLQVKGRWDEGRRKGRGGGDGGRFYGALIAKKLYRESKQSETAWEVPQ